MSDSRRWERWEWEWALVLFLLLLARACAWGVRYWPQLDDYIQLCNYVRHSTLASVQESIGILGARPLAVVGDFYLWGKLFSVLIVGVALISLMYAVAVVMLRRQLGRYFSVSPLFLVIFTLLPLGVEGTYGCRPPQGWCAGCSLPFWPPGLSSGGWIQGDGPGPLDFARSRCCPWVFMSSLGSLR